MNRPKETALFDEKLSLVPAGGNKSLKCISAFCLIDHFPKVSKFILQLYQITVVVSLGLNVPWRHNIFPEDTCLLDKTGSGSLPLA